MIVLSLVLFIALNVFIFMSFYFRLARRQWSLFDTAVGAFLLLLAQVFVVKMLLAGMGQLRLWPVIGIHALLSAGIWAWAGGSVRASVKWTWCELEKLRRAMTWYAWMAIGLAIFTMLWAFSVAVYAPSFAWDAHMYHIPIAAFRLQEGDLSRLAGGWSYIEGYPETGEMFILWQLLFLKSQILVDFVQYPFWLFGMLAVIGVGLRIGARLPHAVVGSVIWVFAPVVILQSRAAYNDLMVAALFWMGVLFIYRKTSSPATLSLTGIAAALMIGIKLGAAYLIVVLAMFAIWHILRTSDKRSLFVPLLIFWLGFGLLNSYWYIDNWMHTGNPLWPVDVSVGPLDLEGPFSLAGYVRWFTPLELVDKPNWLQLVTVWLESDAYYSHGSKLAGFGPLWIVVGLPSIGIWTLLSRKGWPLVMACCAILVVNPMAWYTRYTLHLLGLGSVALAIVLHHLHRVTESLVIIFVLVGMVFSFLVAFDPHVLAFFRIPRAYRTPVYGGWSLMEGAYRWLNENSRDSDKRVYGGSVAFPGLLWGEDLEHTVEYVRPSNEQDWEREVLSYGVEWAFVVVGSREDKFLMDSSQFVLVADDRRIENPATLMTKVYRIAKGRFE